MRALRLGFRTIDLHAAVKPLIACDADHLFVAVPLDPKRIVAPAADSVRITSDPTYVNNPQPLARKENMSNVNQGNGRAPEPANLPDPLEEAEAIKTTLQEVFLRSTRLIAVLRQYRKQHKAVTSAMASLRQLNLTP